MTHRFLVPDMSCGHCKMTIEKALHAVGIKDVTVDLEGKTLQVESNLAVEIIEGAIRDAGYTPDRD